MRFVQEQAVKKFLAQRDLARAVDGKGFNEADWNIDDFKRKFQALPDAGKSGFIQLRDDLRSRLGLGERQ